MSFLSPESPIPSPSPSKASSEPSPTDVQVVGEEDERMEERPGVRSAGIDGPSGQEEYEDERMERPGVRSAGGHSASSAGGDGRIAGGTDLRELRPQSRGTDLRDLGPQRGCTDLTVPTSTWPLLCVTQSW